VLVVSFGAAPADAAGALDAMPAVPQADPPLGGRTSKARLVAAASPDDDPRSSACNAQPGLCFVVRVGGDLSAIARRAKAEAVTRHLANVTADYAGEPAIGPRLARPDGRQSARELS